MYMYIYIYIYIYYCLFHPCLGEEVPDGLGGEDREHEGHDELEPARELEHDHLGGCLSVLVTCT